MESVQAANSMPAALPMRPGERRKHVRFDMHFRVYFRALGDAWSLTETADVSASGAFFVASKPYLLNTPIEYVLTFPPELTKAAQPLRVRFYASVLRCEHILGTQNAYGIAVRNTAHRYLSSEEAASLEGMIGSAALEGEMNPDSKRKVG